MDDSLTLFAGPPDLDPGELARGVRAIQLTRVDGATLAVDPAVCPLEIQRERPEVNGMEGDLGAICEVFRQSSTYYLTLGGLTLVPGDRLTLAYRDRPYTVTIRVAELENRRARIDPPVVNS